MIAIDNCLDVFIFIFNLDFYKFYICFYLCFSVDTFIICVLYNVLYIYVLYIYVLLIIVFRFEYI